MGVVTGVGVGVGASFSTHPTNIITTMIDNMAIKPAMFFLFIFLSHWNPIFINFSVFINCDTFTFTYTLCSK